MTYITRIANKRILAKYFLYSLQINYIHWKLNASRSIFSCYATYCVGKWWHVQTWWFKGITTIITITWTLWQNLEFSSKGWYSYICIALMWFRLLTHSIIRIIPIQIVSLNTTCQESMSNYQSLIWCVVSRLLSGYHDKKILNSISKNHHIFSCIKSLQGEIGIQSFATK